MKARVILLATAVASLCVVARADAQPLSLSKQYETDKSFGIGVALGAPFGVSGKYLLTPKWAVDFGVGGYFAYRDRDGFHTHVDLLWQPFVAVEGQSFLAPMYFGLGGRFLLHDEISHLGMRIPVGIAFDLSDKPLDIFLEAAFVFDFVVGGGEAGAVDANALVGLRYFL